jgi:hypothetical protein
MARVIVPWLLVLGLLSVTVWLVVSRSTEPLPKTQSPMIPVAPECPPQQHEPPLTGLRQCAADVRALTRRLDACQAPSFLAAEPSEAVRSCLEQPDVVAAIEAEVQRRLDADAERRRTARQAKRTAFDEWADTSLGLADEQRQAVTDYVCALASLRARALDDAAAEQTDSAKVLEDLQTQRKAVLKDLEQVLGADRYQQLRQIGGLGLLIDTTDC